jgi:hypothetical protein
MRPFDLTCEVFNATLLGVVDDEAYDFKDSDFIYVNRARADSVAMLTYFSGAFGTVGAG